MKRCFIFPVIVMWIEGFTLAFSAEPTMPVRTETPTVLVDSLSFGDDTSEQQHDWINFAFGNGGPKYPGNLHSACAGEELPIAKPPPGVEIKAGANNVYAGKGEFYTLRYGPYLIGMNMTADRSYELDVPPEFRSALDLISGKMIPASETLKVGPASTVVLYSGGRPGSSTEK